MYDINFRFWRIELPSVEVGDGGGWSIWSIADERFVAGVSETYNAADSNFMDYDQKQIPLCAMDKNKELNIKLKQVPSSYHENDNRVMNNSELLSLWKLISIS